MAKQCEICGKGTATGRKVSHAHNVTSRTWEPNLRSIKALILTSYEPSTPHDDVADWSAEGQVTGAVTREVGA